MADRRVWKFTSIHALDHCASAGRPPAWSRWQPCRLRRNANEISRDSLGGESAVFWSGTGKTVSIHSSRARTFPLPSVWGAGRQINQTYMK